jgi:hypothetical protein
LVEARLLREDVAIFSLSLPVFVVTENEPLMEHTDYFVTVMS